MDSGDGFPAHLLSRMIHVGHSQIDLFSSPPQPAMATLARPSLHPGIQPLQTSKL